MRKLLIWLTPIFLVGLVACEDFVQDVDPLIDQVEDERLNDADQVDFQTKGVLQRMSTTASRMAMYAGGLSDELIFDQDLPRATFPSFAEIDRGEISLDNNSIDGLATNLNEARFFADTLVIRVNNIEGLDPEVKRSALYTSYLVGGLMRQYLASYWGLTETEPGGVINAGPFIPASDMYGLALEKYQLALQQAGDEHETKVVNTLIARIHLLTGNFSAAASAAAGGLAAGDEPFLALHSVDSENAYFFGGGHGRIQWVVDFRFNGYITEDPAEAARIALEATQGTSGNTWYFQNGFPDRDSPFPVATWQENTLILAETDLRAGDSGTALTRINELRASYGLAALASVDLDGLYVERDKTLFLSGARLLDQLRFNRFHLGADKWHHLPITERERSINPNLN
ncbi:MAG: hypothetical protein ACE5IY_24400 [bacterium]